MSSSSGNLANDGDAVAAIVWRDGELTLLDQRRLPHEARYLPIPTIGIGSGPDCDGQILVTSDLWGTSPDYIPKHVQPNTVVKSEMEKTIADWMEGLAN